MPEDHPIDAETKLLAAMAYGEASAANNSDEMHALASVIWRQRIARGHATMALFVQWEPTYSYVTSDGNKRYQKMTRASDKDIRNDPGMSSALAAAENAMSGGPDKSNGAYFWDGADIKSHYKTHFKVRNGIKFTDPSHNIYGIQESTHTVILWKTVVKRTGGKIVRETQETGRYDHVYESTAGIGGTIFWRNSDGYLKTAGAKVYK